MNRRSFLRGLIGAAVGIATGGLTKVATALTTKGVIRDCWGSSGYVYAPYIPLQTIIVFPQIKSEWPKLDVKAICEGNLMKKL